jgi:hypothetical protein
MTKRAWLKKRGAPKRGFKTPLEIVNEKFGSKQALTLEIAGRLEREEGETLESLAKRLQARPNSRLLRLYELTEQFKSKFATKADLVAAVATNLGHGTDKDYTAKLSTLNLPRLLDLLNKKAA